MMASKQENGFLARENFVGRVQRVVTSAAEIGAVRRWQVAEAWAFGAQQCGARA
jgi:hypothetical protein